MACATLRRIHMEHFLKRTLPFKTVGSRVCSSCAGAFLIYFYIFAKNLYTLRE